MEGGASVVAAMAAIEVGSAVARDDSASRNNIIIWRRGFTFGWGISRRCLLRLSARAVSSTKTVKPKAMNRPSKALAHQSVIPRY